MSDWIPGFERVPVAKPGGPYLAGTVAKVGLHTTEGLSRDPRGAYRRHPWPPQGWVTLPSHPYQPRLKLQGIPCSRSAYALAHPAGTPETNKAGVVQFEIEYFAKWAEEGRLTGEDLDFLAYEVVTPACAAVGADPDVWLDCYGTDAGFPIATVRSPIRLLSGWGGFYQYGGVFCHQHTPDNSHWDCGKLPHKLGGRLGTSAPVPPPKEWDEMATEAEFRKAVRESAPQASRVITGAGFASAPDAHHDGRVWYIECGGRMAGPYGHGFAKSYARSHGTLPGSVEQGVFDALLKQNLQLGDEMCRQLGAPPLD
jgi:hypothetical protein